MSTQRVHLEVDGDGVALLTIDNPPMNALHPDVLRSLFDKLTLCQNNQSVKAIVVTGASGKFTAGFDITVFKNPKANSQFLKFDVNQHFCDLLESGPKPTVAAISGICLGGGCELVTACSGRVCTPDAKIGLPELQLGIIPGFGGTQRLPRLVGLKKAIEMMLTSKPLSAQAARENGLVDEVVQYDSLIAASKEMALNIANGHMPRYITLERTDRIESLSEALSIFEFAHAQVSKRTPALQHPHMCIDVIKHGIEAGGYEGTKKERQVFAECLELDTHKALIHAFFAMRSTKRVKGITDVGLKPRPITRVAVLGGGTMGSGIVTALVLGGYQVLLKEIDEKFLQAGLGRVQSNLQVLVKRGKLKQAMARKAFSLVKGVLDYEEFGSLQMVIEAALENVQLKQKIFADLERSCSPDCILATNTSTIDITVIGRDTRAADRIVGAHFFTPAHLMPLLEIVRSQFTSKQVLVDTIELSSRIKKTPVVVGNCTGFAVNRVFFPYSMAAFLLADIGTDPYRIDRALNKFGMPLGPFGMCDLVGADIAMHVGKNFIDAYPDRVYKTHLTSLLTKYNRLGQKTGKGFYKIQNKFPMPDPEIAPIIRESIKNAGLLKEGEKPPQFSDQDITEILLFPTINEGCRVIAEGIVSKPSDLDIASIIGMGFPQFRGGIMFYADLVGARYIHDRLLTFSRMFPQQAAFFKPSDYLKDRVFSGSTLEEEAPVAKL